MLNYANLNDVEFENLCQDIMSKRLNTELRRFARGADGGIDLADNENKIIVQVKHYTDASNLVASLEKELPKVKKLNPRAYYICTSVELSPMRVKQIYELFKDYMPSSANIITKLEIDDFLHKDENIDVLKRHYKLWLDSTDILEKLTHNDIFVDCESLIFDIKNDIKFFVQTSAYNEALKCLENNKTLIITGNPGVGKTTTSKMLVLHFSSMEYTVRYTSNTDNLTELKKSLSLNPDKKEIILVDDCLGQAYFEMKNSQSNELFHLINYVNSVENKVLILNTRVTILQEAKKKSDSLCRCLNDERCKIHVLDMDNISKLEKALILYNHLVFNGIKKEQYNAITFQSRYMNIIEHKNYCPRIIEYVCRNEAVPSLKPNEFYKFIISQLNNPEKMWEDEYENRLQKADRILLQTIYSLTDIEIDYDAVHKIYEQRIAKDSSIDKTIDQFKASLTRLTNSMVKIISKDGKKLLSMVNPSVNDYLRGRLESNSAEKQEMLNYATTLTQYERLMSLEEFDQFIIEHLKNNTLDEIEFDTQTQKYTLATFYIGKYNIQNIGLKRYILQYLNEPEQFVSSYSLADVPSITIKLINKATIGFYNLTDDIYIGDYCKLIGDYYYDNIALAVTPLYECCPKDKKAEFVDKICETIQDLVDEFCGYIDIDEYAYDLDVDGAINRATNYYDDEEAGVDVEKAAYELEEELKEYLTKEINSDLSTLPSEIKNRCDFVENAEFCVLGAYDYVAEAIAADEDYYDAKNIIKHLEAKHEIDLIFNRNYLE